MDYSSLKSGTDIRGTAVKTADKEIDLDEKAVYDLTVGFIRFLGLAQPVIALGHDSRISAEKLKNAAKNALYDCGCKFYDCGLSSTPAMFMATQFPETRCDGAIMLTASHHPYDKNGMKFFTVKGGLGGGELGKVIALADEPLSVKAKGKELYLNIMSLYREYLKRKFISFSGCEKPLTGMKIAVDAGNGSGGFFADVLKEVGADVSASRFLQPDGTFPNHVPNPENAEAMRSISEAVTENGCDLGVIFDTDADRAAIVTSDGKEINRNRLIALMSAIVLETVPGATIVTDSVTSSGLTEFIEAHGGKHLRYKRGYRNVIDKAIELESKGISAPLAIETSGHGALKENYYLDDGAFMAVLLVSRAARLNSSGKSLSDILTDLPEPKEEAENRIKLTGPDWKETGARIIRELTEYGKSRFEVKGDDYEGVRVYVGSSWFMVRQSVHDPVLVINFEGNEVGAVKKMKEVLYNFLSSYDGLDVTDTEKLKK